MFNGFLLSADGKTNSIAYDGSGSTASKLNGGMRVKGLNRERIISPDVPITDDPADPLSWITQEFADSEAKTARDKRAALRAEGKGEDAINHEISNYCAAAGHPFTSGKAPRNYALIAFADNLHGDMLECQLQVESTYDFALEHGVGDAFLKHLDDSGSYGLRKVATHYRNLANGEESSNRMAGEDGIDWFELQPVIRQTLKTANEVHGSPTWFARMSLIARVHVHRCMTSMYSRHTMPIEFVDHLINIGNDFQRLIFRSDQHATFNTAHLSKTNPYLLKKFLDIIKINDRYVYGLGVLVCCQGFERLNAWLKLNFRMLTHGRENSHEDLLRTRFLMQIAGETGQWPCPFIYKEDRRMRFADEAFDDSAGWTSAKVKPAAKRAKKPKAIGPCRPKCPCCVTEVTAVIQCKQEAADPPHFACYRFYGLICADCKELAAFCRHMFRDAEPWGDVKTYLDSEHAQAELAAARGRVDLAMERQEEGAVQPAAHMPNDDSDDEISDDDDDDSRRASALGIDLDFD